MALASIRNGAETDSPRRLGVVLCGGKSTRMGEEKATLKTVQGVDFFEHAARRLESLCEAVVLSVAANQTLPTSRELLKDPVTSFGPISGILRALTHAADRGVSACVFTPVDTPKLTTAQVSMLIGEAEERNKIACAVTSTHTNQLEPLISYIPIRFDGFFRQAIEGGRYGLQKLFRETGELHLVELPDGSCDNLNAPNDLRAYLQTGGHSGQ